MNLIQMLMNIVKRAKKKKHVDRGPDRRIRDRRVKEKTLLEDYQDYLKDKEKMETQKTEEEWEW